MNSFGVGSFEGGILLRKWNGITSAWKLMEVRDVGWVKGEGLAGYPLELPALVSILMYHFRSTGDRGQCSRPLVFGERYFQFLTSDCK